MGRYYEGHERVYQRLAEENADCWGHDDFDNVHMLPFLNSAIERTDLASRDVVDVLVIGCGTGPLACALSKKGFDVNGMDISPTAIELAKQQAAKRALAINYWAGDICNDDLGADKYDLIVDSHCLHCIVADDDRKTAFQSICRALKDDGYFILETMMGTLLTEERSTDADGIVWKSYGHAEPEFEPRVQRDGVWHVPERRIRPTKTALDEELIGYGFRIQWSNATEPEEANGLCDYQGINQRA